MALLAYPGRALLAGFKPAAGRRGRRGGAAGGRLVPGRMRRTLRGVAMPEGIGPGRGLRSLGGGLVLAGGRKPAAGGLCLSVGRACAVRPAPGAVPVRGVVRPLLRLVDVGAARRIESIYVTPEDLALRGRPVGVGGRLVLARWSGPAGRPVGISGCVMWAAQWSGVVGLSAGLVLPAGWRAYPLPAGEWIGYALAALALARGEAWQWDGEGGARVAGRRLMRREGWQRAFMNEATAARWRAQYTAELAGVLAGRLCSPGDDLAAWEAHGRERDRGAARRLLALAEKQADPGKRAALMADAEWLIARI